MLALLHWENENGRGMVVRDKQKKVFAAVGLGGAAQVQPTCRGSSLRTCLRAQMAHRHMGVVQ